MATEEQAPPFLCAAGACLRISMNEVSVWRREKPCCLSCCLNHGLFGGGSFLALHSYKHDAAPLSLVNSHSVLSVCVSGLSHFCKYLMKLVDGRFCPTTLCATMLYTRLSMCGLIHCCDCALQVRRNLWGTGVALCISVCHCPTEFHVAWPRAIRRPCAKCFA